tara:strand:+ start:72 stop:344 length:273 start_codon:yes stop_codon:yes gene_type:complete
MIDNSFRTSVVHNKSGHQHVVYWTEVGQRLYKNGDMVEREIIGLTKKGRKFFGIGCYINNILDSVLAIYPQRSIGWKPVNETKGENLNVK